MWASISDLPARANVSDAFDLAIGGFGGSPQLSHLADEAAWRHAELTGDTATWERMEGGQPVAVATFTHTTEGWTFSDVRYCDRT
jgi:hypothetical protein